MSLVRFAEYPDLVRHLGLTPESASVQLDVSSAVQALDNASAAIRDACKWTVTEEIVVGEPVDCVTNVFFVPTLRLTAFSMSVDGSPWSLTTDYTWTRTGTVRLRSRRRFESGLISYTHGWAIPPASLKQVCLEQASAAIQNPQQLTSVTVGNVTEVYQRQSQQLLAPAAALAADPRVAAYTLPVVG